VVLQGRQKLYRRRSGAGISGMHGLLMADRRSRQRTRQLSALAAHRSMSEAVLNASVGRPPTAERAYADIAKRYRPTTCGNLASYLQGLR